MCQTRQSTMCTAEKEKSLTLESGSLECTGKRVCKKILIINSFSFSSIAQVYSPNQKLPVMLEHKRQPQEPVMNFPILLQWTFFPSAALLVVWSPDHCQDVGSHAGMGGPKSQCFEAGLYIDHLRSSYLGFPQHL